MTSRRAKELQAKAIEIVAQEAKHLADCADYDEICKTDEEDEYLRKCLTGLSDIIGNLRG